MNSLCHLTAVMTASLRRVSLLAAASQSPSQVLCCHLQSSSALFTFRATPYTARIKTTTYMLTTSKSSTLSCAEVTPIQLPEKCHHFSLKASKCLSPKLNSVSSHSQIHSPPPAPVFTDQIPYPLAPNQQSRYHSSFLSFLLIPSPSNATP